MSIYSIEKIDALIPNLDICRGISTIQIEQLTAFSATDPLVAQNTRDLGRFFPLTTADEYLNENGRQIYTLAAADLPLAGIFWIRPVPNDQKIISHEIDPNLNQFTFAARMYCRFRGQHLSTQFIYKSLQDYAKSGHSGFAWAEIKEDNQASIKMCLSAGCIKVTSQKFGKVFVGKTILQAILQGQSL